MFTSKNNILLLALAAAVLAAGIAFYVFKNKQEKVVDVNSLLAQELNKFTQKLKGFGLNDAEIKDLMESNDKFMQAKNEFDANQEELYKKSPEKLEQFVAAVSSAMMEYRFDDQNPAIKALMDEPAIANFIGAWKNVHSKERELEDKYPAFKEFVKKQQEEILQEISEQQAEIQEDVKA